MSAKSTLHMNISKSLKFAQGKLMVAQGKYGEFVDRI